MPEKICEMCGCNYPKRQGQTKYCLECSNKITLCPICGNKKKNIKDRVCQNCTISEKTCPICGCNFEGNQNRKYCSDKCFRKARMKRQESYQLKMKSICNICGCEFEQYGKGRHKVCVECQNKFICKKCGAIGIGKHNTMYCDSCIKKTRNKCLVCGMPVSKRKDRFCSLSCAGKYTSKHSEARKKQFETYFINGWTKESKPNKLWETILTDAGFEVEREFRLDNDGGYKNIGQYCFYDLKVGKYLIEIDPTATHNSSVALRDYKEPLKRMYHQEKSLLGEKHGYQVIHLFDWDNKDFVINRLIGLMSKRKRLYSRDIRIVDSTTANEFCEENHLQGRGPSTVRYGLYVNGELINLLGMLYQKGERNFNRFCSKCGYYIAHGAEKLFKKFLEDYNPDHVISYSDITKHSGGLYNALGFKMEEIQEPSYRRVNLKTGTPYRRRDCQKQRMHRLPGFDPDYKYLEHKEDDFRKQTEAQLMESHGYVRVFDSGMRKHVRYNEKQAN